MQKVIIIGGGVSGVYLASLLEEKYEVIILEARDRLGGRVYSIDGHDLGPSWIWQHHTKILTLIDSLGLQIFPQYEKGYALYDTKDKVELFNTPPAAPSFRLKGSLSELINAIKNKLTNTKILLNKKVTALEESQNRVKVVTSSAQYEADYVVSTLAPRLAMKLAFTPALPHTLVLKMLQTQTWMGNSAKCVIEFKTAFWRKKSLSGFVFSHLGPLGEIHDASLENRPALFGFVSSNADMQNIEESVKEQMQRLFDIDKSEIVDIYIVDWREEQFSATKEDNKPLSAHPQYGIDTSIYSKRILFSSTEFSFEEGGYLEGAIRNADKIFFDLTQV